MVTLLEDPPFAPAFTEPIWGQHKLLRSQNCLPLSELTAAPVYLHPMVLLSVPRNPTLAASLFSAEEKNERILKISGKWEPRLEDENAGRKGANLEGSTGKSLVRLQALWKTEQGSGSGI